MVSRHINIEARMTLRIIQTELLTADSYINVLDFASVVPNYLHGLVQKKSRLKPH